MNAAVKREGRVPRVLFVTHDATRTGAPIYLLRLLRRLARDGAVDAMVLALAGGPLLRELEKVSTRCFLWNDNSNPVFRTLSGAGALLNGSSGLTLRQELIIRWLRRHAIDLVYANTSVGGADGQLLARRLSCPLVWHIHEQWCTVEATVGDLFREVAEDCARVITVSQINRSQLVSRFGVPDDKVVVSYPYIEPSDLPGVAPDAADRIRHELGVGPDTFVVGGCGGINFRKAPELFLLIAREVLRRRPELDIRFVWVGGHDGNAVLGIIRGDIERLGLSNHVVFTGEKASPFEYFSLFDVFLLSSREDSFPLVVQETAHYGVPTVAFKDTSGIGEFIGDQAGELCPYPQIDCMAQALLRAADDRDALRRQGEAARERLALFSPERGTASVLEVIREVAAGRG